MKTTLYALLALCCSVLIFACATEPSKSAVPEELHAAAAPKERPLSQPLLKTEPAPKTKKREVGDPHRTLAEILRDLDEEGSDILHSDRNAYFARCIEVGGKTLPELLRVMRVFKLNEEGWSYVMDAYAVCYQVLRKTHGWAPGQGFQEPALEAKWDKLVAEKKLTLKATPESVESMISVAQIYVIQR